MSVRAKFRVNKITRVDWNLNVRLVELTAVSADGIPENERYHKYTPSGTIQMQIDNPPASNEFELGKTFYVDFSEASS